MNIRSDKKKKILDKLVGPSILVLMTSGFFSSVSIIMLMIGWYENSKNVLMTIFLWIIIISIPLFVISFLIVRYDYKKSD